MFALLFGHILRKIHIVNIYFFFKVINSYKGETLHFQPQSHASVPNVGIIQTIKLLCSPVRREDHVQVGYGRQPVHIGVHAHPTKKDTSSHLHL